MRESAWGDYQEPMYVPGPDSGMIFFGAATGWSPVRENQPEIGCRTCGGLVVHMRYDPTATVPLPFAYNPELHVLAVPADDPLDPSNGLCAACHRWARDNRLALLMQAELDVRGSNDPIPVPPEPAHVGE